MRMTHLNISVLLGVTNQGSFYVEECDGDLNSYNPNLDKIYFIFNDSNQKKIYANDLTEKSCLLAGYEQNYYRDQLQKLSYEAGIFGLMPSALKINFEQPSLTQSLFYSDIVDLKRIVLKTRQRLSNLMQQRESRGLSSRKSPPSVYTVCQTEVRHIQRFYNKNSNLFDRMSFSLELFSQCVLYPFSECHNLRVS